MTSPIVPHVALPTHRIYTTLSILTIRSSFVSKKTWIIFAAVCVALLAGLVYLSSKDKVDLSNVDTNAVQPASVQSGNIGDHVFGKADSKVLLVAYEDFQCPGCASTHPDVKRITEKYKDQIGFVFRNFPLASIHPNARAAAAAAEAAGLQGKYWEMHNVIFENQTSWKDLGVSERTDFFAGLARELKLNEDQFKTDMASTGISQKITYDQAIGKKIGINSTPSFFINGKAVEQDTWGDGTKFEEALVAAMNENGITVPADKE